MNEIKQTELYNVAIRQFNEGHQQLVQVINTLYLESRDSNYDRMAQKLIVSLLAKFARKHFDAEEGFMKRIKYPDLDKHQQSHRVIYTQLLDLESRLQQDTGPVADHAFQFLLNWRDEHPLTEDKLCAEYALKFSVCGYGT